MSSMHQHLPDPFNPSLEIMQLHGYTSCGSEQPRKSSSCTKKRASRAGTRIVSALSAAQLQRKRANDRETQRAIRQRTKDHIKGLERTISELHRSQDASDNTYLANRPRNRELEEEKSYFRLKLSEASLSIELPPQILTMQDAVGAEHVSNFIAVSRLQDPNITTTRATSSDETCSRCEHTIRRIDIYIAKLYRCA